MQEQLTRHEHNVQHKILFFSVLKQSKVYKVNPPTTFPITVIFCKKKMDTIDFVVARQFSQRETSFSTCNTELQKDHQTTYYVVKN